MTQMKAKKKFDCVEYKNKVQAEIYEETKGLTPRQQIEYFNQHAENGNMADWWKKIRQS